MPILGTDPVPILRVSGDPRERGRQHGELAGERISLGVKRYQERFKHFAGLSVAESRELARQFADPIRQYDPDILEEIKGIADGSGVAYEDVLAINCRSELMFGPLSPHQCSSFGLQPSVTANGHTYVGQNWDWAPNIASTVILLVIEQESPKPTVMLLDEGGFVGRMGFNSAGIGLCTNTLISETSQLGIPQNVFLRGVLNQTRLADAIGALVQHPAALPANYLIGDGAGQTMDIELAVGRHDYIAPEDGVITHANHFAGRRMDIKDISVEKWPDSLYRECRLRDLLRSYSPRITAANIQTALSDRFGYPDSISRHARADAGEFDQVQTIASLVIDCSDLTCEIAFGPPDAIPYQHFSLKELVERPPAE